MKHKHAEVIKAFVDGIECEWFNPMNNEWISIREIKEFDWVEKVRIKPQPVIREEYLVFWKQGSWNSFQSQQSFESNPKQFKLIYKDDVLENVEIVK